MNSNKHSKAKEIVIVATPGTYQAPNQLSICCESGGPSIRT
ncbi:hypothetical protein [Desulfosarcina ovata]|uniref:Uncharacterized protein n=1 Tax=Desulfosarcina ovata subsp. ovata TaxID=2752305 RepID=A0A5K8ABS1_9BACT|nr:hypothetical protein [Desulfosarcina ovata]BBO90065.1 hypothetical protein DSCOOX_32450 [Desulfosarcina ovata subsp. ovata]